MMTSSSQTTVKSVARSYREAVINILVVCVLLIASLTLFGDWLVIRAHWARQNRDVENIDENTPDFDDGRSQFPFPNFAKYLLWTTITAYFIYLAGGLFFHYFYYIQQRDQSETWKCQPNKWLSKEQELSEIKDGLKALLVANTWSALLACYIDNGGYYGSVYYKWDEYSPVWLVLQLPILFFFMDYMLYWTHRILHWPNMYRLFHSVHHRYRQPTAFSVVAFHPVEATLLQASQIIPLFTPFFPVYWPIYQLIVLYMFAMGIMNHSGVDIKAQWWQPWQPDTMFHDNHHQYFHVNFGFNCTWFDKLHNTIRKPDCIYREDIYGGKGKPATVASKEELEADLQEREGESGTAYSQGYNPYFTENVKMRLNSMKNRVT